MPPRANDEDASQIHVGSGKGRSWFVCLLVGKEVPTCFGIFLVLGLLTLSEQHQPTTTNHPSITEQPTEQPINQLACGLEPNGDGLVSISSASTRGTLFPAN